MQQRLRRSDEGIEDAVYDSQAIGECIGIDLAHLNAPDDTTLPQFRQLLRQGSAIDATIISAPQRHQERQRCA